MTQMVVEDGVSDWQRALGAESSAEAPADATLRALPLEAPADATLRALPLEAPAAAPVTPDRRTSPVEPLAPLPAQLSSSEATEDEGTESDEDTTIVQRLFVGPSDNIPLLDEERLGLRRREVGCVVTPTDELTEGEMSDTESDVGDVPNEVGRFAEIVFTDAALTAMVGVPVWVLLAALVMLCGYLCILIGSGIISVR